MVCVKWSNSEPQGRRDVRREKIYAHQNVRKTWMLALFFSDFIFTHPQDHGSLKFSTESCSFPFWMWVYSSICCSCLSLYYHVNSIKWVQPSWDTYIDLTLIKADCAQFTYQRHTENDSLSAGDQVILIEEDPPYTHWHRLVFEYCMVCVGTEVYWSRRVPHTHWQRLLFVWMLQDMHGDWGLLIEEVPQYTHWHCDRDLWCLNIVRYASMGTKVYWLRRLHNTHTFTETCDVWILQDLHPLELRFTDLGGRTIHIDRDLWCLNIVRYASIGTEVYWLRRLHNTRTDRDL